jgi:hypothetical protein
MQNTEYIAAPACYRDGLHRCSCLLSRRRESRQTLHAEDVDISEDLG